MFAAHKAKISVSRSEPIGLDVEQAIEFVRKRNEAIARKIVMDDLLKQRTKDKKKSERKIIKCWEDDERRKIFENFTDLWNHWRSFYPGNRTVYGRWEPKNSAQLTVVAKIVSLAKEQDIDLGLLIACTFKAYEYRKISPIIQVCLADGLNHYNDLIAEVMADIGEDQYLESAML